MNRTWGHVFKRIGPTAQTYFHVPRSHVWLVTYYRRIGGSDCRVNGTLTQAQALSLAAKHGITLPDEVAQLCIDLTPPPNLGSDSRPLEAPSIFPVPTSTT